MTTEQTAEQNTSLYGLGSELSYIERLIDSEEFLEANEDAQKAIAERMDEVVELVKTKTDAVCGYNQSLDDYIEAIDRRIDELSDLKSKIAKKQSRFHEYILNVLDMMKTSKVSGALYTISYRKPSQSVSITDENKIPTQYIKTKEVVDIDKKQILADLKNDMIVDGAELKLGKRNLSFKAGK